MLSEKSKLVFRNFNFSTIMMTELITIGTMTFTEQAFFPLPPFGAYAIILIGAIVGMIGVLVNGWALVVIFRFTNIWKKINYYLLVNQIAIDFVACLLIAAQFFSILDGDPMMSIFNKRLTNDALCRLWYTKSFMWAVINSSNCNVVLLTLERYLKILYPLAYTAWLTQVCTIIFV